MPANVSVCGLVEIVSPDAVVTSARTASTLNPPSTAAFKVTSTVIVPSPSLTVTESTVTAAVSSASSLIVTVPTLLMSIEAAGADVTDKLASEISRLSANSTIASSTISKVTVWTSSTSPANVNVCGLTEMVSPDSVVMSVRTASTVNPPSTAASKVTFTVIVPASSLTVTDSTVTAARSAASSLIVTVPTLLMSIQTPVADVADKLVREISRLSANSTMLSSTISKVTVWTSFTSPANVNVCGLTEMVSPDSVVMSVRTASTVNPPSTAASKVTFTVIVPASSLTVTESTVTTAVSSASSLIVTVPTLLMSIAPAGAVVVARLSREISNVSASSTIASSTIVSVTVWTSPAPPTNVSSCGLTETVSPDSVVMSVRDASTVNPPSTAASTVTSTVTVPADSSNIALLTVTVAVSAASSRIVTVPTLLVSIKAGGAVAVTRLSSEISSVSMPSTIASSLIVNDTV